MAESNLSPDLNALRREVGNYLGWGRTFANWTATQQTDFDDIHRRALRIFYFPPISAEQPYYEWSFMRKTGTITLQTNTSSYTLPDDCGGTVLDDSFTYAAATNYPPLRKVPESTIRKLQASDSQVKGVPKYYATRNVVLNATVGQRYQALVFPTPNAAINNTVVTYRYITVPDMITNTNKYPLGGAQYGEVILSAFLAAAEQYVDNDANGMYSQRFQQMLTTAIRNDEQHKSNSRKTEE